MDRHNDPIKKSDTLVLILVGSNCDNSNCRIGVFPVIKFLN